MKTSQWTYVNGEQAKVKRGDQFLKFNIMTGTGDCDVVLFYFLRLRAHSKILPKHASLLEDVK